MLGALFERGRTGVGRTVEVSMLEAMAHFNLDAFTHFFQADEVMGPYSRPSVSQSYVLECADGKWIALHMSSPEKFWQGLAQRDRAARRCSTTRASRPARRASTNQEALIALLGERFKRRTRDDWCARLQREDVPHAPMYDTSEALDDPQARHLRAHGLGEHPVMGLFRTVRSPVSFDGERALEVRPPPTLGEHGDEIRARARGAAAPRSRGMTALPIARRAARRARCSGSRSPAPRSAQDGGAVKMVVPFGPGTTTDTVGRVVADGARQDAAPDRRRRQPRRRRRRDRHRPGRQGRAPTAARW